MIYEKITLNNTSTYWLCWLLTSRISHATFAIDCKMTSEWMTLLQEVIYTGWRKSSRMSMVCKNSKIKKITTLSKCSMMDEKKYLPDNGSRHASQNCWIKSPTISRSVWDNNIMIFINTHNSSGLTWKIPR